jgi:hypothetical protein
MGLVMTRNTSAPNQNAAITDLGHAVTGLANRLLRRIGGKASQHPVHSSAIRQQAKEAVQVFPVRQPETLSSLAKRSENPWGNKSNRSISDSKQNQDFTNQPEKHANVATKRELILWLAT